MEVDRRTLEHTDMERHREVPRRLFQVIEHLPLEESAFLAEELLGRLPHLWVLEARHRNDKSTVWYVGRKPNTPQVLQESPDDSAPDGSLINLTIRKKKVDVEFRLTEHAPENPQALCGQAYVYRNQGKKTPYVLLRNSCDVAELPKLIEKYVKSCP